MTLSIGDVIDEGGKDTNTASGVFPHGKRHAGGKILSFLNLIPSMEGFIHGPLKSQTSGGFSNVFFVAWLTKIKAATPPSSPWEH